MAREGDGDESVKFTVSFDVDDSAGSGIKDKDLEKLVKKLIRENTPKGGRRTGGRGGGSKKVKRVRSEDDEDDDDGYIVERPWGATPRSGLSMDEYRGMAGSRSRGPLYYEPQLKRGKRGRIKAGSARSGEIAPAYERQHQLDMFMTRPDSSAKQVKESWAGGRAPSEGSPTYRFEQAKAARIAQIQEEAAEQREAAAQTAAGQRSVSRNQARRQRMTSQMQRVGIKQQRAAARAQAAASRKQARMDLKQQKDMESAFRIFTKSADQQQKAAYNLWKAQQIANAPQSTIDKFSSAQNRFESMTKKIRTKAQRLNTYGLFFLETAQVNPAYTAGKFLLNTISGMGPHGKAVAFAIAGIASSVFVMQATIKNFSQKGLPLNQDYHRFMDEEVTGMMTLPGQKKRDWGVDGYIVSQDVGYTPVDGTSVYNSQLSREDIRLNKLTQEEKVRIYR